MDHLISNLTGMAGIPTLADMRIAAVEELPESLQIQNAFEMRMLSDFGLDWFTHEPSLTIWLGLKEPELHDHDRWILCVNPGKEDQWYSVMFDFQISGRAISIGDLRLKIAQPSRDYIQRLVQRLHRTYVQTAESAALLNAAIPNRARITAYSRLIPSLKQEDLAAVGTEFSLRELHELLYHYESWAARHPEVDGIPRELVMRMYKLGFYDRFELNIPMGS